MLPQGYHGKVAVWSNYLKQGHLFREVKVMYWTLVRFLTFLAPSASHWGSSVFQNKCGGMNLFPTSGYKLFIAHFPTIVGNSLYRKDLNKQWVHPVYFQKTWTTLFWIWSPKLWGHRFVQKQKNYIFKNQLPVPVNKCPFHQYGHSLVSNLLLLQYSCFFCAVTHSNKQT